MHDFQVGDMLQVQPAADVEGVAHRRAGRRRRRVREPRVAAVTVLGDILLDYYAAPGPTPI